MSIEGKHAYRFKYLKSDQWQAVRLEALVREKSLCQICGEESISNDAHHIWYPENIYETREVHLVILCRPCHEFVHAMLPECKTQNEEKGLAEWIRFKNAVVAWRIEKLKLFRDAENLAAVNPNTLLAEINRIKQRWCSMPAPNGKIVVSKDELGQMLAQVKKLSKCR